MVLEGLQLVVDLAVGHLLRKLRNSVICNLSHDLRGVQERGVAIALLNLHKHKHLLITLP